MPAFERFSGRGLFLGRRLLLWSAGALVTGLALGFGAPVLAESPVRYPYDPACAWGRLSDGHGMLIRCIEPSEATLLLERPPSAAAPEAGRSEGSSPTQRPASESSPPGGGVPTAVSGAQRVVITRVGPAQADTGELPLAAKKLGVPTDRYLDCVRQHGGLTADQALVVVRFLVRERGRAEGVTVKSSRGLSKEAAQCIAEVVDRRYVGYPAAPMVGATLPIELSVQR